MPHDRIHRRHRALPDAGGHTLSCPVADTGEPGHALGYAKSSRFPQFKGDEVWFRVRWVRRGRFEVIAQAADPRGRPLPAEL
jgi:hypothetical protein